MDAFLLLLVVLSHRFSPPIFWNVLMKNLFFQRGMKLSVVEM